MATYTMVEELVRRVLELPEKYNLNSRSTPTEVPGWDSLGWVNIVSGIEEELDIELDFQSLGKVYNLGELSDLVTQSIAKKATRRKD